MFKVIYHFSVISLVFALKTSVPCRLESAEYGFVCTCDENHCDTLNVPLPKMGKSHVLITSSEAGDRFSYDEGEFEDIDCDLIECVHCNTDTVHVTVGRRISHREIIGFGGAFTGAVTHVLNHLTPNLQKCFHKSYFASRFGMGYSMLRMPIGGSDFDVEKWVYNLYPENDSELSNFHELDPRDKSRNEHIKELIRVTNNEDLKIVAAAWYAAPWLRANHEWNGFPNNQILPEYYQTWAEYHVRWLNLMKADGIPIWGISPGNEPSFMRLMSVPTMSWNGTEQGKWLVEYLKPTLKWSGNENVKILGVEDMRNVTLEWLKEMNEGNSRATDNIDIVAIHPYFDALTSPRILDEIHRTYNKPILYTEMSFAVVDTPKILPGSWPRAEELIEILMDSLSHDVSGYIDWNMMLNSTGGPKYDESRGLDAYILANDDFTGFIKQPLFYAMAHFSKYILPGSKRIQTNICGFQKAHVESIAYIRPDRKIAVILYNNHTIDSIDLNLVDQFRGTTSLHLKPKSLNTLVYSISD